MKSLLTLAAVALVAVGCQQESITTPEALSPVAATPAVFNIEGAPTVSFHVPDMQCQFACVDAVKEALAAQPGVKDVKVDFDSKQATVVVEDSEFDGEAAIATLVDYQFTNSKLISE